MDQDEYNRRFKKTAGSLPTVEEQLRSQAKTEIVLPPEADPREERRRLEEAGYDYEGGEEWRNFMQRMGRL